MSSIVRRLMIAPQVSLSRAFDRLLPERYRVDGAKDFQDQILPAYLEPGLAVWDVGGGSRPCMDLDTKRRLELTVVGLDIAAEELAQAPAGSYDRAVVADIASYRGQGDADLVVCKSTLEHVHDVEHAFAALASLLKPGGRLLVFTPCRNAPFAVINRMLPQRLKERLLFAIFPHKGTGHSGFQAYYDRCTPRDLRRITKKVGLDVLDMHHYYISSYFSFFFPLYVIWRAWTVTGRVLLSEQTCETFVLVAVRPHDRVGAGS